MFTLNTLLQYFMLLFRLLFVVVPGKREGSNVVFTAARNCKNWDDSDLCNTTRWRMTQYRCNEVESVDVLEDGLVDELYINEAQLMNQSVLVIFCPAVKLPLEQSQQHHVMYVIFPTHKPYSYSLM